MISDAEILDAWEAAQKAARWAAKGRLHGDDCDSEAGLQVAEALHKFDPSRPGGASFKTYVCKQTKWAIVRVLQQNRRYVHKDELFWADQKSEPGTAAANAEWKEAEGIVLRGGTIKQIQEATGLSEK